jgi:DNA-binding CsgD family transcriptional regulator
MALAGLGQFEEAGALARSALTSVGVEATICARAATAVIALREGKHEQGSQEAGLALAGAIKTGLIESFVCAYRGFPELLVCLLEEKTLHSDIAHIVGLVGDAEVLPTAAKSSGEHSILQLSPREKEVLGLLARGLTNVEIGKTLFISPATAKVHVHHILEKLGVKSRTEAALRAAQLGRD